MPKKIIDTSEKKPKKGLMPPWLKTALPLVVAAIVIVGGVLVWLYVQQRNRQVGETQQPETPGSVVEDALTGSIEIGTEQGQQELQEALGQNPSEGEKIQLLQLLASDAEARSDFAATVSYLKQAFEIRKDSHLLAQNIGRLYLENLNDKPQALKYFKIARNVPETETNADPMRDKANAYLDEQIKTLEAEGVTPVE